jgi:hypothetical protein
MAAQQPGLVGPQQPLPVKLHLLGRAFLAIKRRTLGDAEQQHANLAMLKF